MKHTLALAMLAILLLAATGWGQTNEYVTCEEMFGFINENEYQPCIISNSLNRLPRGMYIAGIYHPVTTILSLPKNVVLTTNSIRKLAASGEICKVFGHSWENFDVVLPGNKRKCKLCGKVETKTEVWK